MSKLKVQVTLCYFKNSQEDRAAGFCVCVHCQVGLLGNCAQARNWKSQATLVINWICVEPTE